MKEITIRKPQEKKTSKVVWVVVIEKKLDIHGIEDINYLKDGRFTKGKTEEGFASAKEAFEAAAKYVDESKKIMDAERVKEVEKYGIKVYPARITTYEQEDEKQKDN